MSRPHSVPVPSPAARPAAATVDPLGDEPGWLAWGLGYLGGIATLGVGSVRAIFRTARPAPPLLPAVVRLLDELLRFGLPLVVLVSMPLGSFLAMQAYFQATFRDAVGAVVGIGLLRNLASLVSGLILAALMAGRFVPELKGPHAGLDDDPANVPDRDVALGRLPDDRPAPEPARLAAARILAGLIASPVLTFFATAAGMVMGVVISQSFLNIAPGLFFGKLLEMVETNDAIGLIVKSIAFGGIAALVACHEGLRPGDDAPRALPRAVVRALLVAIVGILMINDTWFLLNFRSGDPYGPAVSILEGSPR